MRDLAYIFIILLLILFISAGIEDATEQTALLNACIESKE